MTADQAHLRLDLGVVPFRRSMEAPLECAAPAVSDPMTILGVQLVHACKKGTMVRPIACDHWGWFNGNLKPI